MPEQKVVGLCEIVWPTLPLLSIHMAIVRAAVFWHGSTMLAATVQQSGVDIQAGPKLFSWIFVTGMGNASWHLLGIQYVLADNWVVVRKAISLQF